MKYSTIKMTLVAALLLPWLSQMSQPAHGFEVTNENGVRPALSSKSYAHTTARSSDISIEIASQAKGLGAFATKRIPLGTLLGSYGGETMTKDQVRARFWGKREMDSKDQAWMDSRTERDQTVTGNYLLELPNGLFVDAEDAEISSWCRFMNHAPEAEDECNCKAFMQSTIGGETHEYPRMYAIRDIEKGEEICFDYGPLFFIKGAKPEATPSPSP